MTQILKLKIKSNNKPPIAFHDKKAKRIGHEGASTEEDRGR